MRNQNQIEKQRPLGWGKVAGLLFAVFVPGVLIAVANDDVFPESAFLATGMVVVSVGIAGVFTAISAKATPDTRRIILVALVVLSVVLSCNLAAHWVLSREVSGAKQATQARHNEEDRAEVRRKATVEDTLKIADAQKALISEDTRRLKMEAIRNDSARRLGMTARRGSSVAPATVAELPTLEAPEKAVAADSGAPKLTVEQVLKKWLDRLIWFAIADLLSSVVAFGLVAARWEWDWNGDDIVDRFQSGK